MPDELLGLHFLQAVNLPESQHNHLPDKYSHEAVKKAVRLMVSNGINNACANAMQAASPETVFLRQWSRKRARRAWDGIGLARTERSVLLYATERKILIIHEIAVRSRTGLERAGTMLKQRGMIMMLLGIGPGFTTRACLYMLSIENSMTCR